MDKIIVKRDVLAGGFTLGRMYIDGVFFGFTCEDTDRLLEAGGVKVQNETAIPRGKYRVILTYSQHFDRILPEIGDVPGFQGIRIHGGNTAADTEGCILLGANRTANGVQGCAALVDRLIALLHTPIDVGHIVHLEVE